MHLAYLRAGADIITTAGYQASHDGFLQSGFSGHETLKIFNLSLELALDAKDEYLNERKASHKVSKRGMPWVAVSCGPYAATLADGSEYRPRDFDFTKLKDFHRKRIETYLSLKSVIEKIDLFAFETIPAAKEMDALLELINEYQLKAWISMTMQDSEKIADGTPLDRICSNISDEETLFAFGVNCLPPDFLENVIRILRDKSPSPIIAYPNSGAIYHPSSKTWSSPPHLTSWSQMSETWIKQGVEILGGCCNVGPAEIAEICHLRKKQ